MNDVIQSLSRVLDAASQRQQIVASNIANIDTPNYLTRDIDFDREMKRAFEGTGKDAFALQSDGVEGLMERPDGNNVSVERESLAMSDTQLRYRTAAQMLRSQFHMLSVAINEDK